MPKTVVVGDSVAVGIGGAIAGAQVFAQNGLRIDQMQRYFDRAIAAAGQGDTVIISAGYNSTGPNGLSQADLAFLQTNIDQLVAKGARVVIAPLRESGMAGDYARLNGQTIHTNRQLRGLRQATVADSCVAVANAIAGGEIHGAYTDLARICRAASTTTIAANSRPASRGGRPALATGAPASSQDDADDRSLPASEMPAPSSSGIMDFFKSLWDMIAGFFMSLFSGGTAATAPAAAPASTPTAQAAPPAVDPARAQEQARAVAPQTTVRGGQDVESNATPGSPVAGPQAALQRQ